MNDVDMIEQIARHLCRADGYDPDIIGLSGNPRWWLYTGAAEHTIPFLVLAWDEGYFAGLVQRGFRTGRREINPYRQETDA